jgi:hypothetical protein
MAYQDLLFTRPVGEKGSSLKSEGSLCAAFFCYFLLSWQKKVTKENRVQKQGIPDLLLPIFSK